MNQRYVDFAAAQIPPATRAQAQAAGIPWSLILLWLRQFGLPIVLNILQGLLTHLPEAPPPAEAPPAAPRA